jgi:hypothetical protein
MNICYSQIKENFIDNSKVINKINSTRIVNNLKPFKLHNGLSQNAKKICESLQTIESDTLIPNSIILLDDDTLNYNIIINKNLELLGIWSLPHKYKCQVTVIIFDRIMRKIHWSDFNCSKRK